MDKTRAPSDPMDIDSEPFVSHKDELKAEPLYPQRHCEAKTNDKLVDELLAARLHANSPFGKQSPRLMLC